MQCVISHDEDSEKSSLEAFNDYTRYHAKQLADAASPGDRDSITTLLAFSLRAFRNSHLAKPARMFHTPFHW